MTTPSPTPPSQKLPATLAQLKGRPLHITSERREELLLLLGYPRESYGFQHCEVREWLFGTCGRWVDILKSGRKESFVLIPRHNTPNNPTATTAMEVEGGQPDMIHNWHQPPVAYTTWTTDPL